jgi:hypothetical protein
MVLVLQGNCTGIDPPRGQPLRLQTSFNTSTTYKVSTKPCVVDVFEDGIAILAESKQIVISRVYFRIKEVAGKKRSGKGNGIVVHRGGDLYLSETYFEGCIPEGREASIGQAGDNNSTLAYDCRGLDIEAGRTLLHRAPLQPNRMQIHPEFTQRVLRHQEHAN